ncbi:hypothetical protein ACFVXA_06660 [Streptomyces sp. NPDC058246]|uniref:hypothetical protein n=1 Tax=Streptomyces sp. NPDC058246 TaxID=3346400 RepID=UPI0036EFDDC7
MTADWRFGLGLAEGVALGLAAAVGTAAVRDGRLPRWVRARGQVVRPRLWGRALLLLTASVALQSLTLAVLGPGPLQFAGALVSGAGLITSCVLGLRASRDRRRGPSTPPGSPAS